MDTRNHSDNEQEVGSFLASLKRDQSDDDSFGRLMKKSRFDSFAAPVAEITTTTTSPMQPFPFYNYVDHSRDVDPDPFIPLTAPGRVPNFPAKMHAILCRADLQDIVSLYRLFCLVSYHLHKVSNHLSQWMLTTYIFITWFIQICWQDHGRAWKVLKPREFEVGKKLFSCGVAVGVAIDHQNSFPNSKHLSPSKSTGPCSSKVF